MSDLPNLGPKAIDAYNRLAKELAAANYLLRSAKPGSTVSMETLFSINGAINLANRLFRRHPDLPRFFTVDIEKPANINDFAFLVARLTAASLHFEERYDHLKEHPRKRR